LLTGGRAPAALELARQFAAAGHRVFIAESARYHLCRVSSAVVRSFEVPRPSEEPEAFIEALVDIAQQEHIDLIVPTCEEIMYVSQGLERLQEVCDVFTSPLHVMKLLHNKYDFIQLAEQLGFTVPYTRLITSSADWEQLHSEITSRSVKHGPGRLLDKLVLKPVYSRFATNVTILELQTAIASWNELLATMSSAETIRDSKRSPAGAPFSRGPWVAQQFIAGRQICTYSIVHGGKVVAHAAYSTSHRAGLGASIYFEPLDHHSAYQWVKEFVEKIAFTGQIAFDFIERADGQLFPLECNPRTTSGAHLFGPKPGLTEAFLQKDSFDQRSNDQYSNNQHTNNQHTNDQHTNDQHTNDQYSGEQVPPLSPAPANCSMLAMAMLSFGLWQDCSRQGWKRWLYDFRRARDVTYQRDDPRPFWEQLRSLREIWRISRQRSCSLLEATTYDIEWNGDYEGS